MDGIKYSNRIQIILNRFIFPINSTLTGVTTQYLNRPKIMVIMGYSILLRSPELEPHQQMQFSVILGTHFLNSEGLTPQQWIQSAYY